MNGVRDDEVEALQSIYGEMLLIERIEEGTISVTYRDDHFSLRMLIDSGYPEVTIPKIKITYHQQRLCSPEQKNALSEAIAGYIHANAGSEVLFQLIELARNHIAEIAALQRTEPASSTIAASSPVGGEGSVEKKSDKSKVQPTVCIIHGEPISERKSVFQAHIARIASVEDVNDFKDAILSDKKFSKATHNIFAYRFTCPRTGALYKDHDDDGETAAGGRLAEMLRLMPADGVAVIVSRWFGGTLLGPDRFKFICNSARKILEENGYGYSHMSNKLLKKT